jgi:acetyltransferase
MTVRNLEYLFKPTSVAVIGASDQPASIGAVVARNLGHGGFSGSWMPVNRRPQVVEGVAACPGVNALPFTPDLAIVCVPASAVPKTVAELSALGGKAAVVITAGLDSDGRQLMLNAARPNLLRIIGPNSLGIMVPGTGLNASFAHMSPAAGRLAFVTQSGGMATSVLDWATERGIGFSHFVSMGDMADVDFGDMLDYLAADPSTTAVLLYMEAVTNARKFMSAARACARLKPVIIIKAGRHAEGAKAAASHTGALAGADAVYDAAFRRAGLLRVRTTEELFDAVETLGVVAPIRGARLAILTNGGGPGVLATDALIEDGGTLAELSSATLARLNAVLPPTWSHSNPVDVIGDARADRYAAGLQCLLDDPVIDATLVLHCPTAVAPAIDAAKAVVEIASATRKQAVLTSWLGGATATAEQAVRGFMHLVRHKRNEEMLLELPPSLPETFRVDKDAAREVIAGTFAEGRTWLPAMAIKSLLTAYSVPVVDIRYVSSPPEAAREAEVIGMPVALKIASRDITHKSDVGGVALNLVSSDAVRRAAEDMLDRIRGLRPDARLEGFTLEPMVKRSGAYELIVGMTEDEQFGPVLMFGHGGTAVEVIDDKAVMLPPLNMTLAREAIERTQISRQLHGYRNRPAAALPSIAMTLVKIAQMVSDWPEIAELDINPLLADEKGVIALDSRVKVLRRAGAGASRLAIRPYPSELEQTLHLPDGEQYLVRPVRPEDGPAVTALFAKTAPEDLRLRFFTAMRTVPAALAARVTQIDYDREMALVASNPANRELYGIVHLFCDPDGDRGEFAALVRTDMKGHGLGYGLMTELIDYARRRGVSKMFGDILTENRTMLTLCSDLGFTLQHRADTFGLVRATLVLHPSS